MSEAIRELFDRVTLQIAEAERVARDDIQRWRHECDERCDERRRRLHDETAVLHKERKLLIDNLAAIEGAKPVSIVIPR